MKNHNNNPYPPKKKKEFGQHFLSDFSVVERMIAAVDAKNKTVLEIGCGDGFLTNGILNLSRCKKLITVEVDKEWFDVVSAKIKDARFSLLNEDILEFDFSKLQENSPLVLLANLPYNITIQIFTLLVKNKELFAEGVFMVQEEVAQKITAESKKDSCAISLFMQNHFELKLLEKIPPAAFRPPPKVTSRNVYFKPKKSLITEAEEALFWPFVRKCFHHPRQTLRNNLKQINVDLNRLKDFDETLLSSRPQHLSLENFYSLWQKLQQP